MKRTWILLGLVVSGCASLPPMQDSELDETSAPVANQLAANDPNEVICENDRDTGSHIVEKICRTRWRIEEERRQAQEFGTNQGLNRQEPKPKGSN